VETSKICRRIIQEPWKTKKAHVLEPNNVSILSNRGNVKMLLEDYQGALQDLDKANVLEPNNAFILKTHGDAKRV